MRTLDPHSHPPIVAIDTVGFINKLPHSLVASFRSTLEELQEADLLVHVVDASSPTAREQLEVTEKMLGELKVDKTPRITVLNKADQVPKGAGGTKPGFASSRRVPSMFPPQCDDMRKLRDLILSHFHKEMEL